MPDPVSMLKELGEPLVREAFDELLSSDIPSTTAKEIIIKFKKKWKDYARPALMILVCEAAGGDPKKVAPVAKAMILSAGAFDIHDDIIDKTYERNGKKTLLGTYGQDAMLLTGDALMIGALAYLPSMRDCLSHGQVMRITECMKKGLFELGSAELDELQLIRNIKTTPEQYLRIVRMKAADVESYTKIGAVIAGADEESISKFAEFGRLLGMITILRDDIEDTFNDNYELLSRITKESYSLPIVFSLQDQTLLRLIQKNPDLFTEKDLEKVKEIVEKNHGFEKTKDLIGTYVNRIKKILGTLPSTEKIGPLFK